jgi:hypothetical protein
MMFVWDATMLVQTTLEASDHHTTTMPRQLIQPRTPITVRPRTEDTGSNAPPHNHHNLLDKEPRQKIGGDDTQPIRNQPKAAPYTEKLLRLRLYSTIIIQAFTATLLKKQSYPKKSLLWTGSLF